MVIEPESDAAWELHERMPAVTEKGKWGFIDMMGGMIINPQVDNVLSFRRGLASVKMDTKWGYIDKTGKMVIGPRLRHRCCRARDRGFGFSSPYPE